jgi:hypothetical protein
MGFITGVKPTPVDTQLPGHYVQVFHRVGYANQMALSITKEFH